MTHFITYNYKVWVGPTRSQMNALCAGQDSSTFERGNSHIVMPSSELYSINIADEKRQVISVTPQSSFVVTSGNKVTTSENVEFMDNNPAFNYLVGSTDDPTRAVADMADASLGDFLSRPILIKEYTWTPNSPFFETFDPWSLFLNQSRNVNRIANFNLFRSKLCVKFLVNGNGFYYGRLLASYTPLPDQDEVTETRTVGYDCDNVAASQRPHIYINPTECQGGDLCVPFVHWQNALKVPESQWSDLGRVSIQTLTALKNANGATDAITLSVFAYVEEPNMSIPTNANPITITPQSDEYGDNPVSGPASTVARVSGMLTSIPSIAPFAKATQIAAGAVGSIAKLFGMSRPAVIDPIQIYKPQYVGGLANTNTPDGTNKLSMDVKQEVTIDPSVVGVSSTDEMSLASLAQRESYYCAFQWDPTGGTKSGPGYRLFQTQVLPTVFQSKRITVGAPMEYHLTPAGYAALPFDYWAGSMEFRFQVVCSNFHRGRIRVVWDPVGIQPLGNDGYNTAYNRIIDITDMKDFTFKVGWGKEFSFLPCDSPMEVDVSGMPRPTRNTNPTANFAAVRGNGILSVYIVNDLTVPNSDPGIDNSIEINVFTKMCDDVRFAQPCDMAKRSVSYFRPPNDLVVTPQAENMEEQEMAPVSESVDTMVASSQPVADHMMSVFFGEEITSIRQMIKRYNLHSVSPMIGDQSFALQLPDMPYYNGYCPDGVTLDQAGNKFNYSQNTYLNYFTPAFVAYRGGLRWKHLLNTAASPDCYLSVNRSSGVNSANGDVPGNQYVPYAFNTYANIFGSGSLAVASAVTALPSMSQGGFVTPTRVNPCAEVDLPFYNNRRFMCARRINNLNLRTLVDELPPVHDVLSVGDAKGLLNYVAAAEDFSLNFFLSVPTMYSVGLEGEYPIPTIPV